MESSESLLEGLFYDRRRYDISNVGRYVQQKLGPRSRIAGHMLAAPVVDPMTGEIIAEAGEVLTRERAEEIAEAGVNDVYLDVDGKSNRVFGNGMVDMKHYVDFDPASSSASRSSCAASSCASSWSSTRATRAQGG